MPDAALKTVRATRYVTPLREGGSLPAIVEADDDGLYVLKFRGAGQGARALTAELVSGEIARALGLPVPDLVFMDLDADLARTEPDPEIFALIGASAGLNLALDYLPGSVMFDPLAETLSADLASRIVWFDAFVSNVDRTARNTNMLLWHRQLWLIDHGASLYFHHTAGWDTRPGRPRPAPSWRRPSVRAEYPYDYALIRVVPRVERGERVNVGIILSCPDAGFLEACVELDPGRLRALDPTLDVEAVGATLATIPVVARGGEGAGAIGGLPQRQRFHWLVSPRSTTVQVSRVHTGRTSDPAATLRHLVDTMVKPPGAGAT